MKKSMIKKILSICATLVLAFVAVVTFTAPNKQISANAEETELPDTSTWEEVTPQIGDKIAGVWFRIYLDGNGTAETIFTFEKPDIDDSEMTLDYTLNEEYVLVFYNSNKYFTISNNGTSKPAMPSQINNETYVDFCLSQGYKYTIIERPNSELQKIEHVYCTLTEETFISGDISERLKVLKAPGTETPDDSTPTPDEPTNPGDSTTTPGEPTNPGDSTTTPDDSTTTPDDSTDESKQEITDKFSNWLNKTFGFNTTGSIVGSIALVVAGFFIVKALFGKK